MFDGSQALVGPVVVFHRALSVPIELLTFQRMVRLKDGTAEVRDPGSTSVKVSLRSDDTFFDLTYNRIEKQGPRLRAEPLAPQLLIALNTATWRQLISTQSRQKTCTLALVRQRKCCSTFIQGIAAQQGEN